MHSSCTASSANAERRSWKSFCATSVVISGQWMTGIDSQPGIVPMRTTLGDITSGKGSRAEEKSSSCLLPGPSFMPSYQLCWFSIFIENYKRVRFCGLVFRLKLAIRRGCIRRLSSFHLFYHRMRRRKAPLSHIKCLILYCQKKKKPFVADWLTQAGRVVLWSQGRKGRYPLSQTMC